MVQCDELPSPFLPPCRFGWSWFGAIAINGYAVQSQSAPGKLQVSLGPFANPDKRTPFQSPGNYWIIELGPMNSSGKYEYAVVSGPDKLQLYILARDPAKFKAQYETNVLESVKEKGFTTWWNKPRVTNQKHCYY